MEFFLFDLAATLVFLLGYFTVATLRQARPAPVPAEPATLSRSSARRTQRARPAL